MNLKEIIAKLTQQDLAKINQIFEALHPEIPTYTFSKITDKQLNKLVKIKKKIPRKKFDYWFQYNRKISKKQKRFLKKLITENKDFMREYSEEDLKINFLGPLLNHVNYKSLTHEIRAFYDAKLYYETKKFILNGKCDFFVSKGLFHAEKPYFFIQEFKKGENHTNPRPQLLAELISAIELNHFETIKGAYIIGSIWNFVILEKIATNHYQYYISENFDGIKIKDLIMIYKNLLFVKNEIIQQVKKS